MDGVRPVVRYLIVCEDIRTDPANPRRATLVNVISAIRSADQPAFPLLYRELCVFVQLTECRGSTGVAVTIVHAETGQFGYPGPAQPWAVALPNDPLEVVGLRFRIRDIPFPLPGLYWVQFWCGGELLAQQPLVLR
jgi:hypothetical protein